MSETEPDPLLPVARDLRELEALSAALPDEVIYRGPHSSAMVMLGHVANLEAWGNIIDSRDERELDTSHVEDHDPHWEPPLQTLLWWSEQWRVEHGKESDYTATVASEAAFLSGQLEWAWNHEPRFSDFAADIHSARRRLEDVLRAGERPERTQVPCTNATCQDRPRLVRVYGDRVNDDHYKCPACKHRYDKDAFTRAHAKHLRSEGAERYVRIQDARDTLRSLGRSERTIRKWFEECLVGGYCDAVTREVWCWWPDLWHLHLTTQTRRRDVA